MYKYRTVSNFKTGTTFTNVYISKPILSSLILYIETCTTFTCGTNMCYKETIKVHIQN